MKKILSVALAVIIAFSTIAGVGMLQQTEVSAATKTITVKPTEYKNVEKVLPEPMRHYPTDKTSSNYSYVFKIKLDEASKLRITGLARYTFWNWGGEVNYKLANSLVYSSETFMEAWSTGVYSDHSWDERAGNYCDRIFTLNKGTYYLFVRTDLASDWRGQEYFGETVDNYPSGLWLSVNKTIYTKTPTLKSVKSNKPKTMKAVYSKVPNAKGYQVQYSPSKKFTGAKSVTARTCSVTLGNLKKGKTYFVRVRAYRTLKGVKYYGRWSKVKSVKVGK